MQKTVKTERARITRCRVERISPYLLPPLTRCIYAAAGNSVRLGTIAFRPLTGRDNRFLIYRLAYLTRAAAGHTVSIGSTGGIAGPPAEVAQFVYALAAAGQNTYPGRTRATG
jgi:hypothetical protein